MNYLTAEKLHGILMTLHLRVLLYSQSRKPTILLGGGFRLFSMLTLALFQMGILELTSKYRNEVVLFKHI